MRRVFAALVATYALIGAAAAADTDGKIKKFDPAAMTIVLDDGKTYKLPAEMDTTGIAEGVDVVIAYDSKDGVNQITDMLIQ